MTQTAPEPNKSKLNGASFNKPVELEQEVNSLQPEPRKTTFKWLSGGRGLLIGMTAGIALTLVGTRLLSSQPATTTTETATTISSSVPAQSVTVAEVESSQIDNTLKATGTVAALEMVPVLSQATGLQIKQILVDEGAVVKAGQLMARLDDSVLQAQLSQAKASVAQAEARLAELKAGTRPEEIAQAQARVNQEKARLNETKASIPKRIEQAQSQVASAQARLKPAETRYNEWQKLVDEGVITQDRFNEALSEYESAKANLAEAQQRLEQARSTNSPEIARLEAAVAEAEQQLKQLRAGSRSEVITQAQAQLAQAKAQEQLAAAQLKDTRVVAPLSGKVAQRNARVGDVTSSSQKLFTIIEQGRLELLLKVPETQLTQINPGQEVQITSDSDSSLKLSGKVREIDPVVEEQSRSATVKVDLPAGTALKPGMFLQARIATSQAKGLAVPSKAVLPQADGSSLVYQLTEEGTVTAQAVETGEILPGEKVEVKSGLSVGDRVVVKGAAYLKDGDKVEVSNE
ncbi:MAG: efflux RND transporter periplasmic adaptor subunit [Coleofasciculaceae cyanobacterium]